MSERGLYIVYEGTDGTGKSTVAIDTAEQFSLIGRRTLLVLNDETHLYEPIQEPGGTAHANMIRRRIKDASIARTPWENVEWFTECRKSDNEELIQPALEAGIDVITARNYASTIVYQGMAQGIPIEKILEYTREHVGESYMTPDLMAILSLTNKDVLEARLKGRGTDASKDTFESMPEDFQAKLRQGYIDLAEMFGLPLVDASQNRDAVFDDSWELIEGLLLKKGSIRLAEKPAAPYLYEPRKAA